LQKLREMSKVATKPKRPHHGSKVRELPKQPHWQKDTERPMQSVLVKEGHSAVEVQAGETSRQPLHAMLVGHDKDAHHERAKMESEVGRVVPETTRTSEQATNLSSRDGIDLTPVKLAKRKQESWCTFWQRWNSSRDANYVKTVAVDAWKVMSADERLNFKVDHGFEAVETPPKKKAKLAEDDKNAVISVCVLRLVYERVSESQCCEMEWEVAKMRVEGRMCCHRGCREESWCHCELCGEALCAQHMGLYHKRQNGPSKLRRTINVL